MSETTEVATQTVETCVPAEQEAVTSPEVNGKPAPKKAKAVGKKKPAKAKPKKAKGKKSPKKPAKAKPSKAEKAKPSKAKPKAQPDDGDFITKPQQRILAALVKKPLKPEELMERASICTRAWLSEYLGCPTSINDGYIMKAGQRTRVRKLVPAGLVQEIGHNGEADDTMLYQLTKDGAKALERLS